MDLLAQMATFVRIVDAGSLTAAAKVERLSVPAVSRQLRALEDELGTALVVRTTRRLHVTDEGRRWYAHCVRILREIADARASVAPSTTARGRLRVSVPISFGTTHVISRLRALAERHPELQVELRMEDHFVDLVAEGIDVVVRAGTELPDSSTLVAQPLVHFDRVAVASPSYLRRRGTPKTPSALTEHACLAQLGLDGRPMPWRLHRDDERLELPLTGPLCASAPIVLRDAAALGLGCALVPTWLVTESLADGRLRRVLPPWTGPRATAWAVYPGELRESPRVRAFVAAMRS